MTKVLLFVVGLNLMLSSYGCVSAHHHDEYREHHREIRDGGYDRDYDEHWDQDEYRDYDDRR